jgi:hypothetical protein
MASLPNRHSVCPSTSTSKGSLGRSAKRVSYPLPVEGKIVDAL